jgi:hypothetical protein
MTQPHSQQTPPVYCPYYAVPGDKFVIMAICSLGTYLIYWGYRNWACVKYHEGTRIKPLWRGYFSMFFTGALAVRIRRRMIAEGMRHDIYPWTFLAIYLYANILSYEESLVFLFSYIMVWPVYVMNDAARRLNMRYGLECGHDEFSFWDRIWLIGGPTTLVLAIVMYMFPGLEL